MYYALRFGSYGQMLDDVIEYRARIKGHWHTIRRHDAAHDRPNIDHFDPVKGKRKQWRANLTIEEGFDLGVDDLTRNWNRYRDDYVRSLKSSQESENEP